MEGNNMDEFDVGLGKLRTMFKELQREKENMADELAQVRRINDEMGEEIVDLKSNQQQLKEQSEDHQELVEKIADLENEKKKMEERHKDHRKTEETLLAEVQHLKKELEAASSASHADEDIEAKDEEIDTLSQTNETLRKEIEELGEKAKEQDETNRTLETKLAQVSQEKQNIEKRHTTTLKNVDSMKSQYAEKIKELQAEAKLWKDREAAKNINLKKQEEQNLELRKWMKTRDRENSDLKKQAVALQKQRGSLDTEMEVKATPDVVATPTKALAIGVLDVVVPEQNYSDNRVHRPLRQLFEEMLERTIISMVAASIGPECEKQLVITCVSNHKEIEKDLRQALDTAKLGLLCPIVVIFHHLAQHRCPRVPMASERRISDGALLKRCRAIVDVVYWQNVMYQCHINEVAVEQLTELLTPTAEGETSEELASFQSTAFQSAVPVPSPRTSIGTAGSQT